MGELIVPDADKLTKLLTRARETRNRGEIVVGHGFSEGAISSSCPGQLSLERPIRANRRRIIASERLETGNENPRCH